MVVVDLGPDVAVIEALDFEPDLPCEVTRNGTPLCTQSAVWIARATPCGHSHLASDACRVFLRGLELQVAVSSGAALICSRCLVRIEFVEWLPIGSSK